MLSLDAGSFLYNIIICFLFEQGKINGVFQITNGRIVFSFLLIKHFGILQNLIFIFTDKDQFFMYQVFVKRIGFIISIV